MNLPTPTKGEVWLSIAIVCLAALALSVVACDPLQAQTTAPGPRSLWDQLRAEWRLPAHIEDMSDEQYARHAALCEAQRLWQRETAQAGVITSPTEDWQKQQRRYVEQALRNRGLQIAQPMAQAGSPLPEWAKDRADHVLRVQYPTPAGIENWGSGTYLGACLVLTADHVTPAVGAAVTCYFRDGVTIRGSVLATEKTWDIAVIEMAQPHPSLPGVPLSDDNPKPGDQVYATGYDGGRPQQLWRPGRVIDYGAAADGLPTDWFRLSNAVQSGSSGGGVFDAQGCLIGNLWGASPYSHNYGTTAVCLGRTKRFLLPWNARLEAFRLALQSGQTPTQWCYGGNCPPQPVQPQPGGRNTYPGTGPTPPPVANNPPPAQPTQPITPVNPQANCPCDLADIDAKFDRLESLIAKLDNPQSPTPEPGPIGPAGPPGPKGEPCDLQAVIEGVYAKIEANADKFRGPPGPPGPPGDSATPTSPAKHWVVIGDPEAEYAKRLEREVAETKPVYDQIELIPPPEDRNVGLLPKLVLFSGATPVLTYAGTRDVYLQLSRIRRGEVQ